MSRIEQFDKFVNFLLEYAYNIEFACARYDDNGKVSKVIPARAKIDRTASAERKKIFKWLSYMNFSGHNVWIRPADESHQIIMIDDLSVGKSLAIARKYRAAVVETSPGNCQVHIVTSCPLARTERQAACMTIARLMGGDPHATSEPRWARAPGFRQRKPGKQGWTNLICISDGAMLDPATIVPTPAHPTPAIPATPPAPSSPQPQIATPASSRPHAPSRPAATSGRDEHLIEFAYACHCIRHGVPDDEIIRSIADRALSRGKRRNLAQAIAYAHKTVLHAHQRVRP